MDVVSIILAMLAILLGFVLWYTVYMSSQHGVFKKMGVVGPAPWPVVGNFLSETKKGIFQFHVDSYQEYKGHKVFGIYRARHPVLVIRDLEMIKDVCARKFNHFVNRIPLFEDTPPIDRTMSMLQDEEWKKIRTITSPTFSTGKLKRMYVHVKRCTNVLLGHLKTKQEKNELVELKDAISSFTMDVVASTGFGYEVDSFNDPDNQFQKAGNVLMNSAGRVFFVYYFLSFCRPVLRALGIGKFPSWVAKFFAGFVDQAKEDRRMELEHGTKSNRNDFLQLMMEAEDDKPGENDNMNREEKEALGTHHDKKKLSSTDIQGQAFFFILAGFETVATTLSFTSYLIALNPECCKKAQDEVDRELQGEFPTYDSVQKLHYLDMCINEATRLFPPGFFLNRVCNEEVELENVCIPKGMSVLIPVCGIHRDPDLWPEPEKFQPERFTPENKAKRHPYAHIPFGQGPRNCIGMRLALIEMKVALAALLQTFTPVACEKSVYPVKLEPLRLRAQDGLWVRLEPRAPLPKGNTDTASV